MNLVSMTPSPQDIIQRTLGVASRNAQNTVAETRVDGGVLHVATVELGHRVVVLAAVSSAGTQTATEVLEIDTTSPDWEERLSRWVSVQREKPQCTAHPPRLGEAPDTAIMHDVPRIATAGPSNTLRPSYAPPPLFPPVGNRDRDPVIPGPFGAPDTGVDGMLVGPSHPLMQGPPRVPHARFDPVAPFGPFGPGRGGPSGDPDFDELLPPQPYSHMFS